MRTCLATLLAAACFSLMSGGLAGAGETVIYLGREPDGSVFLTDAPRGRKDLKKFLAHYSRDPEERKEFLRLAKKHSRTHEVDWRLVKAVIEVESGFDERAVSKAGAQGLMQIMPETQKELGVERPYHPDENIEAGVRYLKEQMVRFKDVRLALAAYNAGPERVVEYGGIPPFRETREYVEKVMARYEGSLSGAKPPGQAKQPGAAP